MPHVDIAYEELPDTVKDNLTETQWREAEREAILEGMKIPDTTFYVNLKNGQRRRYDEGERANAPLLPEHDLAGARGKSDEQFHSSPPDANVP